MLLTENVNGVNRNIKSRHWGNNT